MAHFVVPLSLGLNTKPQSSAFATFSGGNKGAGGGEDILKKKKALIRHIQQLGRKGRWEAVLEALDDAAFALDNPIYNVAINAMVRRRNNKQWGRALYLSYEMKGKGLRPTLRMYNSVIVLCARCGESKVAGQVLKDKCEDMLDGGIEPDQHTYDAGIGAYAHRNPADKALHYRRKMEKANLKLDLITYTCVIKAYADLGDLQKAVKMYEEMRGKNIPPTLETLNTLIDAFVKARCMVRAKQYFREMEERGLRPTLATFHALIGAYAKIGDAGKAMYYLQKLADSGLVPIIIYKGSIRPYVKE